MSKKIK